MNPGRRCLALAALLTLPPAWAGEPWSDAQLPVTNGLAFWYDAAAQTQGRGARGLSLLRSWGDAPEILLDGSGNRHDLVQPLLDARPAYRVEWGTPFLDFDGVNDYLASIQSGLRSRELTLFVVANPREIGGYRGLMAGNATGQNDYTTGFNFDFGSAPSTNALFSINVEGAGFGGERNLLKQPSPLNHWHVFAVKIGRPSGVEVYLDGRAQGTRPVASEASLALDEFTLGARRYSNTPDRSNAQGFFKGALAEALVFDRALTETERAGVEHYLEEKYGAVLRGTGPASIREGVVPLVTVTNPPPIKLFEPGFEVNELPLELGNINNLRYRPDGKLLAVGYDGRIWLLSDTDGDGNEDHAELFYDGRNSIRAPIGAALTPPGYSRGNGVFLPAKDRLVLVVDTNGDDRADQDITIATWKEMSIQHGVDALGAAMEPDGSLYFSLGCASYVGPYLVDRTTGKAGYNLQQERGTILRVSPDLKTHEIVCTGIRFAVGMAFNPLGDLFVTDQEGATWQHDGNPFDELLYIQPGRHYGFPPRHPRYLPNVFDEPSVFDYAPQHQSTCGLCFDVPWVGIGTNGDKVVGSVFGPSSWQGDALVTGYSRGKLWRTQLVKTEAGYVAQNHLLATLQMLTVDSCVSPRGDLIIATHSGQPDWGSGPSGKGRLWRIRYTKRDLPQPVTAWNASPTELKIAFDRPLNPNALKEVSSGARIEGGRYVFPGDRFETVRPGYQAVYDQLSYPRYVHEVLTTQLSPDRRTLSLITRPRESAVNYAVTLPEPLAVDLATSLNGVEATWTSADGAETLSVWLPHLDLKVARAFSAGSAEHERFFAALARPGSLKLRGQLDLWEMLQPAIQPGTTIDWVRPPENIRLRFDSSNDLSLGIDAPNARQVNVASSPRETNVQVDAPGQSWVRFELTTRTGPEASLSAVWFTDEDPRPRAFPLRRFLVPWARPSSSGVEVVGGPRLIPEIDGGNWLHGRRLFFGDRLGCAKCHLIRGEGVRVGPELSNLIARDYGSVRKDIEFPNAAINPDHVASVIELNDGDSLIGIVLSEKEGVLRVASAGGVITEWKRADVKATRPAALSLMPEGLWAAMSATEQRDLMTFLLTDPLAPFPVEPEIQGQKLPPARRLADVRAVLNSRDESQLASRDSEKLDSVGRATPLRIVLCSSPKDAGHGAPGYHDYPLWRERWSKLLALADGVSIETADRWPSAEQWQRADVVALYHDNPAWAADKAGDLDAFLARGGGLIFLHWSMNAYRDVDALHPRLGWAWGPGAKFRYGPEPLELRPHALTAGLPTSLDLTDEAYWHLTGRGDGVTVLATTSEEGEAQPQVWVREQGRGRVFVCIPGHFTWTYDDPMYRVLLLRGLAWAGKQPLDRFNELVTVGARFVP